MEQIPWAKSSREPASQSETMPVLFITFSTAFAMIVYEVFLTRFFAVFLDYNYTFLVISVATLGMGMGGFFSYRGNLGWKMPILGVYALSFYLIVFVIYVLPYQNLIIYSSLVLIPFILAGYILAGIMQSWQDQIHLVYFADLLGAGLAAPAAVFFMNQWDPMTTISFLSCTLYAVFYFNHHAMFSRSSKIIHGLVLFFLFYNLVFPVQDSMVFRAYQTSPNTALAGEPNARIIFSDWNAISRTDVYETEDKELLYMTIDGGAVSPISKFSGNFEDVNYLQKTTASLAFLTERKDRALIIGAGGGQEVLTAKMAGIQEIEAVDINPGSFQAVESLQQFAGNVFGLQGVKTFTADGRNYIRQTRSYYDLIFLSLVKKESENGMGLALSENYLFTQEAIYEYMDRLTKGGRLAFLVHDEAELNKIFYAAINYFRERGVTEEEIPNHLAVIGTYQHLGHVVAGMHGTQITRPLILLQKEPFQPAQSNLLWNKAMENQQYPIHIPYIYQQYTALTEFLNNLETDVLANRDDRPFFYYQTGQVPGLLWIGLIVTLVFVSGITLWNRQLLAPTKAAYFGIVAIGFMLIEITLVQKLTLPLGHPVLSFVLVLSVLLISGGLGSYYSRSGGFL